MNSSHAFECDVISVLPNATCVEVADEMDLHSVGCVVVAEKDVPIGIITDRDLVCRVVAVERDPEKTYAADIMTPEPLTAARHENLESLLARMRDGKVRRIPIVEDKKLVGLVSLDDLIVQLGSYIFNANRGILGGLQESRRTSRHRRNTEAREEALEEIRRQLCDFGEHTRDQIRERLEETLKRFGGTSF